MPRELNYNVFDLFPDAPAVSSYFKNTPDNAGYQNQYTEGVSPSAFIAGSIGDDIQSSNFVTSSAGWRIYANGSVEFGSGYFRGDITGASGTFSGTITATTGSIGGFSIGSDYIKDVADSFGLASTVSGGDDVRFWAGDTFANRATADFRVTEAGAVVASSMTITGGAITGTPIASIPNSTATDISLLDLTHDMVFSVTDLNTVAWASGTITMSNGRTFSITGSNTGNMAARTYIYLDTAVSSTALQTTTAVATAMGANKKLIAVAQNQNAEASFTVFGGIGGIKLTAANTSVSNNNWTYSGAWSVTDLNTIAWGAGTLSTSNGGAYSITGSNTGNMAAKTYVYFDLAVSATAFQTTTTASTAIGDGKILIAICQNGATEADFIVVNDKAFNIDASNIVAGSITANEISAGAITAVKIDVSQLSAITADMGSLTAGTIVLTASGHIRSGQTDYNTGTGFFLGISGGTAKFSIGNPAARYLTWDGSTLTINGYAQTNIGTFGGDGSDGALAITSGTTTIDLGNAPLVVKNYTSISITSTGKLAFSNPATGGTTILLKSQGNVTITSTATCIDASNCGAAGGASVSDNSAGGGGTQTNGNTGTDGSTFDLWTSHAGVGADPGGSPDAAGGAVLSMITAFPSLTYFPPLYKNLFVGGGGGSGMAQLGSGAGNNISGVGGRGGGCLIIECAGAWNFTTASGISVGGSAGGAATAAGTTGAAGGGGGGGGGCCYVLYNTLTADSGTIVKTGGAGGDGDSVGALTASGGGGGGSVTAGANGTENSTDADGGVGGDGYSLVSQNKFFG